MVRAGAIMSDVLLDNVIMFLGLIETGIDVFHKCLKALSRSRYQYIYGVIKTRERSQFGSQLCRLSQAYEADWIKKTYLSMAQMDKHVFRVRV
jgi:hypothetical protein